MPPNKMIQPAFLVKRSSNLEHLHSIHGKFLLGRLLLSTMDRIGTPSGFQSIVWTFVWTVSRCLIFPALPEVAKVTWAKLTNHRHCCIIKSKSIQHVQVASSSSLPTGQYGLCFGYCFSGPLPLHSHLTVHLSGSVSGSP